MHNARNDDKINFSHFGQRTVHVRSLYVYPLDRLINQSMLKYMKYNLTRIECSDINGRQTTRKKFMFYHIFCLRWYVKHGCDLNPCLSEIYTHIHSTFTIPIYSIKLGIRLKLDIVVTEYMRDEKEMSIVSTR